MQPQCGVLLSCLQACLSFCCAVLWAGSVVANLGNSIYQSQTGSVPKVCCTPACMSSVSCSKGSQIRTKSMSCSA